METALTLIVWVGLFIIGPPALLFWLIRRRRRRERAAREAAAAAVSPDPGSSLAPDASANPDAVTAPQGDGQSGNGYRFPYGMPMVIYPILAIALPAVQRPWLLALLELLLVFLAFGFTREAFSRASFEQVCANDPSMNLATWRINWLVFFAAPPAVLAVFGAARLWAALA